MTDSQTLFKENFFPIAEQWGKEIRVGDSSSANKTFDKLNGLLEVLSKEQINRFLPELCWNKSESIRLWSATFLLQEDEPLAIATINKIIAGGSIIGLHAEFTLDTWKTENKNI